MTLAFLAVSSEGFAGNHTGKVVVNKVSNAFTIITDEPSGTIKTYDRSGYAWYNAGTGYRKGAQTGTIDFVFAADNKVYIKQPLSKLDVQTWVEGTLSSDGKTITVPLGQYIATNDDGTDAIALHIMEFDEDYEEYTVVNNIHEVTYTVSEGTIKLNGTSEMYALGGAWASDGDWCGFCDYASVYTESEGNRLVFPPEGLETDSYELKASAYVAAANVTYPVEMGFSGNDVYLKGIFSDTPNAWIKGTKSGDKITFEAKQYLGQVYSKDYFFLATTLSDTHTITPLVLTLNSSTRAYENTTNYAICSGSKTQVYFTEALSSLSLKKVGDEGVVFDVPYVEGFDSQSAMTNFTIINANGDSYKWGYNSLNQRAAIDGYGKNNHDDWLITPAIRLENGKTYKFSLKARSFVASWPEAFSVCAGTEPTVAGMTTTVIAETEVETGDMTEFSGEYAAKADGIHYFGIHCTSKAANQFTFSIDDINVEEVESTGVNTIVSKTSDNTIYTLQGVKVDSISSPGIYVIGGKKYVVK